MKVKTLSLLGGAAAMLIAGTASASFLNVNVELHSTWSSGGVDYDVYRMYANFDGAGTVSFWGGEFAGELNIFTTGGTGFFQAQTQSTALPLPAGFFYDFDPDSADHSSFMTIGVGPGYSPGDVGEVFQLTPGFSPTLGGSASLTGIGGVVTEPSAPNAQSVDGRVLLGQFTLLAGETIATAGAGLGDGSTIRLVANGESMLVSIIPAPGALALLGLAGLVGTRRRRA